VRLLPGVIESLLSFFCLLFLELNVPYRLLSNLLKSLVLGVVAAVFTSESSC
jgi:hypothetical protein